MHPLAANLIVESVRRRVKQGDCPTEPAQSVESLEETILELAHRAALLSGESAGGAVTADENHQVHVCGGSGTLTPEARAELEAFAEHLRRKHLSLFCEGYCRFCASPVTEGRDPGGEA